MTELRAADLIEEREGGKSFGDMYAQREVMGGERTESMRVCTYQQY